jgi:hypothetical protein
MGLVLQLGMMDLVLKQQTALQINIVAKEFAQTLRILGIHVSKIMSVGDRQSVFLGIRIL